MPNRIRSARRPASSRRGHALIELALSLPLLLSVILVTIQGTMLFASHQTLVDHVHQVAESAANEGWDASKSRDTLRHLLDRDSLVDSEDVDIEIDRGLDSNGSDNLKMQATLRIRPLGFLPSGPFEIKAQAIYRIPADPDEALL